MKKQYASI